MITYFADKGAYSPIRNCREYPHICFGGLEVVIFALKTEVVKNKHIRNWNTRLLAPRPEVKSYSLNENFLLIRVSESEVVISA